MTVSFVEDVLATLDIYHFLFLNPPHMCIFRSRLPIYYFFGGERERAQLSISQSILLLHVLNYPCNFRTLDCSDKFPKEISR